LNQAGLDFYSRLVDLLLERGIQPFVTLYHWDLPAALDERGGWLNPDIAGWFADYARIAFEALGDRVAAWATLNEPWVSVDAGYMHGTHAPGHNSLFEAARAAHQLLRAHGAAIEVGRAVGVRPLGIVINLELKDPASNRSLDVAAARRAGRVHEPPVHGSVVLRSLSGRAARDLRRGMARASPIRLRIDSRAARFRRHQLLHARRHAARRAVVAAACEPRQGARRRYTATGWEVYPEGLLRTLLWVKERYGDVPLYVTENGAAFPDRAPGRNGRVEDPLRVRYYRDHLRAAREAIRRGVDLRGYFAWSLLDNYEWSAGFSKRFGIVRVDYRTQRRTLKASGEYYRRIVASNGAELGEERPRPATTRARRARSRARSRPQEGLTEARFFGTVDIRGFDRRRADPHMATIKDVAKLAGVSVATVSRVFNDSSLVSEPTRDHVRGVAEQLNYWPNGVARSLITNRTNAIGVLLPDLFGEFFSEVIRGIDRSARKLGLHLLLSSSHADTEELIAALRVMRGRIDGLIVMAPDVDAPGAIQASGVDFPFLLIDPGIGVDSCDTISIANFAGAQAMVRHLQSLGHTRIATITGPAGNIDAQQRLEGYRSAMGARRGGPELEIAGDFSEPSGYAAAEALLALDPRPTAVFAANDYMAIGVMSALNESGLACPRTSRSRASTTSRWPAT
jgi:beta-glucosidase